MSTKSETYLSGLIRYRWEKTGWRQPAGRSPTPELTPSLKEFFQTPGIWTVVRGIPFTPAVVAAAMIVRADGNAKEQNRFSVFLAMREDLLAKQGIIPLTVTRKQHNQIWDKPFIAALYASIQESVDGDIYIKNHIAYRIQMKIKTGELQKAHQHAVADIIHMIYASSSYKSLRTK